MKEIWKDIPDYPYYQVSNTGLVKKIGEKEHLISQRENCYRRGKSVHLFDEYGKMKTISVGRLVAFTFLKGNINDKNQTVNHIDGNRMNNNLSNLEIISRKENIQKAFSIGLCNTRKVEVTNTITNETKIYPTATSASLAIGKNKGYINMTKGEGTYKVDDFIIKVYPVGKYYFIDRKIPDFTRNK